MTELAGGLLGFLAVAGGLVLVHELGHLICAQALGVRVLGFSLGFGPALLSWFTGRVEVRICLVPLGGYLSLAGEDAPARQDDPAAVGARPVWQRALLVLSGPFANVLAALVLMAAANLIPRPLVLPAVGSVEPGSPAAAAGVQPGDEILAVDGMPLATMSELRRALTGGSAGPLLLELRRGQTLRRVRIEPQERPAEDELGRPALRRHLGISPWYQAPAVALLPQAAKASGLRDGDEVRWLDGRRIERFDELQEALATAREHRGIALRARRHEAGPFVLHLAEPVAFSVGADGLQGLAPAANLVASVRPGSTADDAGLQAGDLVTSWDGAPVGVLSARLQATRLVGNGDELLLSWRRGARELHGSLWSRPPQLEAGTPARAPADLGITPWPSALRRREQVRWLGPTEAIGRAAQRLLHALRLILAAVGMFLLGVLPISSLGGPIFLYDVVQHTVSADLHRSLELLGFLSLYLGVMNLLPLPGLDGGTLAGLALEGATGRRPARRLREIVRFGGLLLLALILILALKNDIARYFP